MSRSHDNQTPVGWQAQRQPSADQDPRAWSGTPQGQQPPPQQQAQPNPQATQAAGYPPQQPANPPPNREPGYHYPQQAPVAPQMEPYPATQPPYAQQPHAAQPQHSGLASGAAPTGAAHPPPGHQPQQAPDLRGANYEQWSIPAQGQEPLGQDPQGYDLGSYMPAGGSPPQGTPHPHPDPLARGDSLQAQPEWSPHAQQLTGNGGPALDQAYHGGGQPGYEHAHAGALEQNYPLEDSDYEIEEPRRGSWTMRIAGAVVVAVGLGFGLAQVYKLVVGSTPEGATPLIIGDSGPSKTKPTDPGGKQFAHTDSKIMGRLGDNSSESAADGSGARKVQTLVVGRDGSIVPPASPPPQTGSVTPSVVVPGMTVVDGFGGQFPQANNPAPPKAPVAPAAPPAAKAQGPVVVNSPNSAQKPVVIARTTPTNRAVNAKPAAPKAPAASAPKKPAPPPTTATGSNGYVAVLASVPVSSRSRLAALQRFADMQQKYSSVLQNKTPDIREANLGERGTYHRLLVGPPGSRAQASSVCSQLKSAGHTGCWVTAY